MNVHHTNQRTNRQRIWRGLGRSVAALALLSLPQAASVMPSHAAPGEQTIFVDSRNPGGVLTAPLEAGTTYSVVATGSYAWLSGGFAGIDGGTSGARADAECTSLPPDPTWQRQRFLDPDGDFGDLYVDGGNVEWEALSPELGTNCAGDPERSYKITVEGEGAPLHFAIHELNAGSYTDNFGGLTVEITKSTNLVDQFDVPANVREGATSSVTLSTEKAYRLEIQGTFGFGDPNSRSDAECLSLNNTPYLRYDFLDDQNSTTDVLVNQEEVDWIPKGGSNLECDSDNHTYTLEFLPKANVPVNFRVNDTFHGDNTGDVLTVKIYELGLPPVPPEQFTFEPTESVKVDSADADGATSLVPLIAGETYMMEVSGRWYWGLGYADAECANIGSYDQTFLRDRFASLDPHALDLLVNEGGVSWVPTKPNPDGCNTDNTTYRYSFVAPTNGPVHFRTNDSGTGDNVGVLTVDIFLVSQGSAQPGTLVDEFRVWANGPAGTWSSETLQAGQDYRIQISGEFTFGMVGFEADAECLSPAGAVGVRNDELDASGSTTDVYVNGIPVDWIPTVGPTGCNDLDHTYTLDLTPQFSAPVNLKVNDNNYADNAGEMVVKIFAL